MLLKQAMRLPFSLAFESAGRSIAAKIAMMAITTSSSIKVKAPRRSVWQGESNLLRLFMWQVSFTVIISLFLSNRAQGGLAAGSLNAV